MVQMVSSKLGVKVEAAGGDGGGGSSSSAGLVGRLQLGRLNKRAKVQTGHEAVEEPSPLGLRLKKTPSFLDLVQSKLSNGGRKKDRVTNNGCSSSAADSNKLKASNFPASLLTIGDWEYKSRYEGDLVGKCYFAKHKLVWEVLDGGLKNKIEIQWSDIVAINAVFSDDEDQPETLNVVLSRPPLFFRETNPQPRKHTLWQASTDFTGGQASIHRQHYLECRHGFMRKHFEKLVQCDPRLNILSKRQEISLPSPCFEHTASAFGDLNKPSEEGMDVKSEDGHSVFATSTSGNSDCHRPPSTITGSMTIGVNNVNSSEIKEGNNQGPWRRTHPHGLQPSMSIDDLVNYIGHCTSELRTGNNILEEITHHLLSDSQFTSSDEESVMLRVNSFCCLLQKDPGAARSFLARTQNNNVETGNSGWTARSNEATPPQLASQTKSKEQFPVSEDEEHKSTLRYKAAPLMSRDNSVGELLDLPRIASVPRFLPNM
ncbi:hypothetical protein LINPERPRIM_LOCUS23263 [Linum perenne]